MNELKYLYQGNFNISNQQWQPSGSVIITLYRYNEPTAHKLHVRDFGGPNEELLDYWEIKITAQPYASLRIQEARKDANEDQPDSEANL